MDQVQQVYDYYYIDTDTPVPLDTFDSLIEAYFSPLRPNVIKQKYDEYGLRPHTPWYSLPNISTRAGVASYYLVSQTVDDVTHNHHILIQSFDFEIPDRNAAVRKLNQQKFQHYQTMWGSEAAEMKQNLTILKDMLTLCVDAYKAFTRGNISKAARLLKVSSASIASPYLFYQFGIKPLFYLMSDICNDLQKGFVKQSLHTHSARSRVWKESTIKRTFNLWGPQNKRAEVILSLTRQDIIGFNSDSIREPVVITDFSSLINYLNPIRIAWELVPYSFIVDYFVGVSDFLGSYNLDYVVKEIYNSEYAGWRVSNASCSVVSFDDEQVVLAAPDALSQRTYFIRTPTVRPPVSELKFSIDLNTSQLLATVAVLLQRVASSKLIK